jgi:hypothetical protein
MGDRLEITMKTKIAIVLSVLFVAVPMATPKATSTGLKFSASCDGADSCTITGSGLTPSTTYQLDVADSCGSIVLYNNVTTSGAGALNTIVTVGESFGCNVTGWTFTLFTIGRRPSQVATTVVADVD